MLGGMIEETSRYIHKRFKKKIMNEMCDKINLNKYSNGLIDEADKY